MTESAGKNRPLTKWLALVIAVAALAGIAWSCGTSTTSWKEEVKLSDGQVIVVKRTASAKVGGEIGGPGSLKDERTTLEVIGSNPSDKPPVLDSQFVPIILDRDPQTKEWFAIATFYSCQGWYDLKRPKLPYTEFRVVNGKWQQFPISSSRVGMGSNLLGSIDFNGEQDHTLQTKTEVISDPSVPAKYRQVIDNWSTGC